MKKRKVSGKEAAQPGIASFFNTSGTSIVPPIVPPKNKMSAFAKTKQPSEKPGSCYCERENQSQISNKRQFHGYSFFFV